MASSYSSADLLAHASLGVAKSSFALIGLFAGSGIVLFVRSFGLSDGETGILAQ